MTLCSFCVCLYSAFLFFFNLIHILANPALGTVTHFNIFSQPHLVRTVLAYIFLDLYLMAGDTKIWFGSNFSNPPLLH